MKTVVGLFEDFPEARTAALELERHGFARADISIVANDATREFAEGADTAAGAGSGAAFGGATGLALGLAALAIPGVGPIVAAGPLATALTGAGIGAAAGGLIGGLTHMGVDKEDAFFYNERVTHGEALVIVKTPAEEAAAAEAILEGADAESIEEREDSDDVR